MRFAQAVLAMLVLLGCSSNSPVPTFPSSTGPAASSPAPTSVVLWLQVIEEGGGGVCIVGATVEVISGQAVGQKETITEPCNVWWIDGIFLRDLAPNVEMTLRASAPGYAPRDTTVMPRGGPQMATIIELRKNP